MFLRNRLGRKNFSEFIRFVTNSSTMRNRSVSCRSHFQWDCKKSLNNSVTMPDTKKLYWFFFFRKFDSLHRGLLGFSIQIILRGRGSFLLLNKVYQSCTTFIRGRRLKEPQISWYIQYLPNHCGWNFVYFFSNIFVPRDISYCLFGVFFFALFEIVLTVDSLMWPS